jgi:DNA-binding NtrC family response regulator
VTLPPLRERLEDVALLANHFLAHYWNRHRGPSLPRPPLAPAALEFLRNRVWRGNVRELQNAVENMAVLAEPGAEIQAESMLRYCEFGGDGGRGGSAVSARLLDDSFHTAKDHVVANFEREYLIRLVARSGGNLSRAARLAGIDRTTLYRLFEKHGVHRPPVHEGLE